MYGNKYKDQIKWDPSSTRFELNGIDHSKNRVTIATCLVSYQPLKPATSGTKNVKAQSWAKR